MRIHHSEAAKLPPLSPSLSFISITAPTPKSISLSFISITTPAPKSKANNPAGQPAASAAMRPLPAAGCVLVAGPWAEIHQPANGR